MQTWYDWWYEAWIIRHKHTNWLDMFSWLMFSFSAGRRHVSHICKHLNPRCFTVATDGHQLIETIVSILESGHFGTLGHQQTTSSFYADCFAVPQQHRTILTALDVLAEQVSRVSLSARTTIDFQGDFSIKTMNTYMTFRILYRLSKKRRKRHDMHAPKFWGLAISFVTPEVGAGFLHFVKLKSEVAERGTLRRILKGLRDLLRSHEFPQEFQPSCAAVHVEHSHSCRYFKDPKCLESPQTWSILKLKMLTCVFAEYIGIHARFLRSLPSHPASKCGAWQKRQNSFRFWIWEMMWAQPSPQTRFKPGTVNEHGQA